MSEEAAQRREVDPDVMGGLAVFTGTGVLVETVLTSLEKGLARTRLLELFPALTDEHIEAAKQHGCPPAPRAPEQSLARADLLEDQKQPSRGITPPQTSLAPWGFRRPAPRHVQMSTKAYFPESKL